MLQFHYLISIILFLPVISSICLYLLNNFSKTRDFVATFFSILTFAFIFYLYSNFSYYQSTYLNAITIYENIYIGFNIDKIGILFALMASFLWILTTIYSIGYLRNHHEKNQTSFYIFFALSITSTLGIAFSNNLFTLFIFYEALTLITLPLILHSNTKEAKLAGKKYLGILLATSMIFFLPALVLVYILTDNLNFTTGGLFISGEYPEILILLTTMFIFGISKAGIMPFHNWLPAAMVAPTPVSALLHAVAVVKSGVFALIKIILFIIGTENLKIAFSSLELNNYLYIIPSITIILSSIIALKQDNLKKRLAYSTISQLSYIILATVLLSSSTHIIAPMQIIFHAFAKITLFFAAGSLIVLVHKNNISELTGIAKSMPITMVCFFIASLSIIGLPLTGGFIGKWNLITASIITDNIFVILVLISSTVLNAMYFLPISFKAFQLNNQETQPTELKENIFFVIQMIITTAITILLFFFSNYFTLFLQ
jgi:multicomponent Na+:H+ antiporter subunit D